MLHYLVEDHPVGVNLGIALRVQHNSLICPEVCQCDLCVLGTIVNPVDHLVLVKI